MKQDKNYSNDKILHSLNKIYPDAETDQLVQITSRIIKRIDKAPINNEFSALSKWDQQTCVLISYADSISSHHNSAIQTLDEFITTHLDEITDTIHILPFFPSSGDDGFSVTDYLAVDKSLGSWSDIEKMSKARTVMADVILNHASKSSKWFQQFLSGEKPGQDFFITVTDEFDVSKVVRPRAHKLLQPIETKNGEKLIWCTFSGDQIDLNFANPELLEEFIKIILEFIDKGIRILRLDAVGFLWKESGTSCLNLEQTHAIIKLIRMICDQYQDDIIIVTETNLPNQENLSYFGNGNEAHWIYNFSLPPLILYSLLFADSSILRRWSMSMPPALEGTTYLNFLSSHDGFGMRPTEGLMSDAEREKMLHQLKENGGLFSWRTTENEKKRVYEANITLYNALEKTPDDPQGTLKIPRLIAAHALIFGLEGIPALYINSLIGAENDTLGVKKSGINRRINRKKFEFEKISAVLANPLSKESLIIEQLKELLQIRKLQPAFHPNATQFTLQLGSYFFGIWRQSRDRTQSIFAITNLSASSLHLSLSEINLIDTEDWSDLITKKSIDSRLRYLEMNPYQTVWITNLSIV